MLKPSQYTTFYVIRHSETEFNIKGLMQGQVDSLLTENGKKQAKLLAKKMKYRSLCRC